MPQPYPIEYAQVMRRSVGSSDTITTDQMPVLACSHCWLTVEADILSGPVSDNWLTLLGQILQITIAWRGVAITSCLGSDLVRTISAMQGNALPIWVRSNATNARRIISILIPFGRRLWDLNECWPPTQRGEAQVLISWDAATATYDTLIYTLEFAQMQGVRPQLVTRISQQNFTPSATGNTNIDLPRGNPLLGCGFFMTTTEPTSALCSIESVTYLADFLPVWYTPGQVHQGRALQGIMGQLPGQLHTHIENTAAMYAQNAVSLANRELTSLADAFLWHPFDVTGDLRFALDGRELRDLKAQINFNVADACRLTTVELMSPAYTTNGELVAMTGGGKNTFGGK